MTDVVFYMDIDLVMETNIHVGEVAPTLDRYYMFAYVYCSSSTQAFYACVCMCVCTENELIRDDACDYNIIRDDARDYKVIRDEHVIVKCNGDITI